jgi:hypothetical protein
LDIGDTELTPETTTEKGVANQNALTTAPARKTPKEIAGNHTKKEILDEIARVGNYTDAERDLREALNIKKLGESGSE